VITFSVEGLAQALTRFAALQAGAKAAEKVISQAEAEEVLERAQDRVPVLTGALKGSLKIKEDPAGGYFVGSEGLPDLRAQATEFGTFKDPAQPWLRPAADGTADEAASIAIPVLLQALGVGL